MGKCAQSVLSVFPVFALGIWTLRYEPLVSGSSCSLFGCTFLAQCLVRLWIHICVFFGAVLGLVVDMSVDVQRQGFGQTVEKTVGSAVAFLVVVAVPGWRVVQILWCKCGGDSRLPQMQLIRTCSWTRSLTCLRCVNGRCLVFGCRNCGFSALAVHRLRCGRPCDFAVTCLAVGGATHSVHRLIWWTSQFAQRQWVRGCDA